MKLFCIQFDGQPDYIEADDMASAIRLWAQHNRVAREFDGTETPESCALVHDESVIRGERIEVWTPQTGWVKTSTAVSDELVERACATFYPNWHRYTASYRQAKATRWAKALRALMEPS